jgi:hypothetical protein
MEFETRTLRFERRGPEIAITVLVVPIPKAA